MRNMMLKERRKQAGKGTEEMAEATMIPARR